MDFVKVLLHFCVLYCAALCLADDESDYRNVYETCIVHYLKAKGKLHEAFQLKVPPSSSRCPVVFDGMGNVFNNIVFNASLDNSLKGLIMVQSIIAFPGISLCLNDKFDDKEAIDYFMKIHMLLRSDSVNDTQLKQTRNKFKNMLKEIAVDCIPDDANYIKIFNYVLGIKNETLEAHQQEYCIAKYVADNKLLELKNVDVDVNPHHVDLESVNCEQIIDVERNKCEGEFRDKLSAISSDQTSLDIVMNDFKRHKGFDWIVALKFLNKLDIPSQVREYCLLRDSERFGEKFEKFITSFVWFGVDIF